MAVEAVVGRNNSDDEPPPTILVGFLCFSFADSFGAVHVRASVWERRVGCI
jgi:hypothetical protein